MEVIEIGAAQLLILLDKGDVEKYGIGSDEKTHSLREKYSTVLSDLEIDRRFFSGVLVQIFNSENGGCEMFVTKMPDSLSLDGGDTKMQKECIYIFDSLSDLLLACKVLSPAFSRDTPAYSDKDRGQFFLILDREEPQMGEFLGRKCRGWTREYILEHCTLLCSDAGHTLSDLI